MLQGKHAQEIDMLQAKQIEEKYGEGERSTPEGIQYHRDDQAVAADKASYHEFVADMDSEGAWRA